MPTQDFENTRKRWTKTLVYYANPCMQMQGEWRIVLTSTWLQRKSDSSLTRLTFNFPKIFPSQRSLFFWCTIDYMTSDAGSVVTMAKTSKIHVEDWPKPSFTPTQDTIDCNMTFYVPRDWTLSSINTPWALWSLVSVQEQKTRLSLFTEP